MGTDDHADVGPIHIKPVPKTRDTYDLIFLPSQRANNCLGLSGNTFSGQALEWHLRCCSFFCAVQGDTFILGLLNYDYDAQTFVHFSRLKACEAK